MGSQANAFAWDPMGHVSTSAAKRPARRSHLSETLGIMQSRFPSLGFLKAFVTDVEALGIEGLQEPAAPCLPLYGSSIPRLSAPRENETDYSMH